jgi:hypothetical protein
MKRLGVEEPVTETSERAALPQIYADMHGWNELVDRVTDVVESLPPGDREQVVIFAGNYGEAGALQFLGRDRDLPPVASGHNSYWTWGNGGWEGGVALSVGIRLADAVEWFEEVDDRGTVACDWCMPVERKAHILVLRGPRLAPDEIWRRMRRFM